MSMFLIGLLSSILNASKHKKCVSLSTHKCKNQPTLINLHATLKDYITIHLQLI